MSIWSAEGVSYGALESGLAGVSAGDDVGLSGLRVGGVRLGEGLPEVRCPQTCDGAGRLHVGKNLGRVFGVRGPDGGSGMVHVGVR